MMSLVLVSYHAMSSRVAMLQDGTLCNEHMRCGTGVHEINTHPTCGKCRTPPLPPNGTFEHTSDIEMSICFTDAGMATRYCVIPYDIMRYCAV